LTTQAPFRTSVLEGGLRVVTETVPGVRSAAFGVWVGVGSRDEGPSEHGASHFLEHLLFKGTNKRDALEISAVMDAVGGEMNAFTAKEFTCYYARVLDQDLPLAVDVVTDLVTGALLSPEDVESERGVILEEISMHDDDPGDVVHDAFAEALFGDHALGRRVIGSAESVASLSRQAISDYYRSRYRPQGMVVSVAGNVDHDEAVDLVRASFRSPQHQSAQESGRTAPEQRSGVVVEERPTEQAHLVLGMHALPRDHDLRWALSVLNTGLGGGMSSRLFQEIREKRGLVYSVYSYVSSHADAGVFGVYAGCAPSRVPVVIQLARAELASATEKGLTDEEVERAKGAMRGSLVLGLEDTGAQMSRIGKAALVHGEVLTVDELVAHIDAVTPDDVRIAADLVLTRPLSLGIIGPFADNDFSEALQ
jgi:predicted Zn-dependent peptidase